MPLAIPGATLDTLTVNGIRMAVYQAGPRPGPAVVLCHGFPELAYSWRHQMPALAAAGYHVIAPDQRGYGGTDRPDEIEDYDIFHLTGDLAELLRVLGVESAVFAGHDWGGLVAWQMPLLHPERVRGVIGVNTPYSPRWPVKPTDLFRMAGGDNHYILFFQTPGVADELMAKDVRGTFSGLFRRGVPPSTLSDDVAAPRRNWAEALADGALPGDPLLNEAELDAYVDTFEQTGFTGGLNWYRNFDRNWELTPEQEGATIGVPCLMVTAEWDPVLTPALAEPMAQWIADLETRQIAQCGHWTQQERPDELNGLMLDWLVRRFPPEPGPPRR